MMEGVLKANFSHIHPAAMHFPNTFLFDAGVSENGVIHNADLLGIRIDQISGIILSHGHFDHFTGLLNVLKRISSECSSTVDIFLHPDAFLRRWEIYPDGKRARLPFLDEKQLKVLGATIHKNSEVKLFPTDVRSSHLITGKIPRNTSFERGFPFQYAEKPHNGDDDKKNMNLVPILVCIRICLNCAQNTMNKVSSVHSQRKDDPALQFFLISLKYNYPIMYIIAKCYHS